MSSRRGIRGWWNAIAWRIRRPSTQLATQFDTTLPDGDVPGITMTYRDPERWTPDRGARGVIRWPDGREWPVLIAGAPSRRDGDPCPRCGRPTFVVNGTGGAYGCDCLPGGAVQ